MKQLSCLLLALICCTTLHLQAFAATYVDDLAEGETSRFKTYFNLTRFPMDGGGAWSGLPDRTAFTFANRSNPVGWVDYAMENAHQITVGIYSLRGTFVHVLGDGSTIMGLSEDSAGTPPLSGLSQALFSPSARGVYAEIGGQLHRAHAGSNSLPFLPLVEGSPPPPADLTGYGINVYTATSGSSLIRRSLTYSKILPLPGSPFVYEELTAYLPAGTAHIRVELNDAGQFPAENSPSTLLPQSALSYNCLASVTMVGEGLVYGPLEPLEKEPLPPGITPDYSDSDGKWITTQVKQGSRASSTGGGGGGAASSGSTAKATVPSPGNSSPAAPSSAASKFSGVIESPTPKPGSSKTTVAAKAAPRDPAPADAESTSQPSVYNHREVSHPVQLSGSTGQDDPLTVGVAVYVLGVGGAILVISARKKKK